jgi:glyoxylase-like metal-dependent hydrolase (beta-lactamase superfamily II)
MIGGEAVMTADAKRESQMWPINGASKARRLSWGSPQNQISWTYMKMLREGNKTMRVYNVNPYVEVYQFGENLYGLFNQNCDGAGDVWQYLILGPEKAMLIDTAFGLGDQRGLVDEISGGRPLIVVNTHLGPDHSFGNVLYDRVYCHEYEVENIRGRVKPGAWDYLFDENGDNIWLQFDRKDLPEYRDFDLIGVADGHIFNLGGDYDIELAWTAGHSAGHAMYIDKIGRSLFAGDDVCSDVIGCGSGPREGMAYNEYRNLTAYRDRLAKLVARRDEFDYIFPGHFMVKLENRLIVDILETLNAIIADPDSYDYVVESIGGTGNRRVRMHKFIPGFGTIAYTENGIYPPAT